MARKTSFYYSFLVLPADQRRAIIAVWDFCRAVDDAVDEAEVNPPVGSPSPREALAYWRDELARCYGSEPPDSLQGRSLKPFVREFSLPRQAFEDVVDGVAMDLDRCRYETFNDLFGYCRRVASAVGMICIRIFRCQSEKSTDYALNLGVALQLTNIVRDVKDDLAQGRLYIPLEDLSKIGCSVEDLQAGRVSEPVRRLLAFECQRARDFYRRALDARPEEDRRRLVAAEIMRAVYFQTLMKIERNDFDVFSQRTRVAKPAQVLIALKEWLLPT